MYKATIAADGAVSVAAGAKVDDVADTTKVTKRQVEAFAAGKPSTEDAAKALVAAGVVGADKDNTTLVKMSFEDKNGKVIDGGYALSYNGKQYAAEFDEKTRTITAKTVAYTDDKGAPQKAAIQFGGVNGKTEVASVGGKEYRIQCKRS